MILVKTMWRSDISEIYLIYIGSDSVLLINKQGLCFVQHWQQPSNSRLVIPARSLKNNRPAVNVCNQSSLLNINAIYEQINKQDTCQARLQAQKLHHNPVSRGYDQTNKVGQRQPTATAVVHTCDKIIDSTTSAGMPVLV